MVNPAFSESQLKNLRRQNRHLVSTHRRKLVFLQASRNPAHGSGRPFFVRDAPVPASFCPAPVSSPLRPPFPPLPSSDRSTVLAAPYLRLPASPAHRTELGFVLCALPFRIPAGIPGTVPSDIFLPGSCRFSLRPSGSRFRRSPAPTVPPSPPLLPSSSSLSRTPDKVRVRTVHAAVPHHRPAPRERSRPTSFCPAFAPPAPASAAPPFSLFPAAAPPLPAATGRTGCSFGPAREKGCLTDLRQPRFYPYAIRELLPIRNFQRIGKTRQTAPFIRTAVRELLPPPPNMPLKGSKNLPDSSVRSRIAQPADRLPAPAAAGLSSSSHRSSGSPDR